MAFDGILAAGIEISLAVLASLVALWLVFGPQHWVLRFLGLTLFAAPLAWAKVHDFLIIWGTQVVALFLLRAAGKLGREAFNRWRDKDVGDPPPAPQYSLRRLLIGTVPAALLFSELHYSSLDARDVIGNVEIGLVWALAAACVWLARYGRAILALHWLPLILFVPAFGYSLDLAGLSDWVPSQQSGALTLQGFYYLATTTLQAWLLLLAVYLWNWLPSVNHLVGNDAHGVRPVPASIKRLNVLIRRSAMAIATAILFCILGPGAALYVYMAMTPRPIVPAPPQPNAYVLLLDAGRKLQLQDAPFLDPQEASAGTLTIIMSKNQTLLDELHRAAQREAIVPLTYHRKDADAAISSASILRQIARTLVGEANFHGFKGQTDEAARISLDCIRVAMLSERGGLIMNSLIGVAITGVGVANLHKDVAELNGQQAREIGKVLRELEEQLETADEVIQRDHLWCRIAFGWRGQSAVLADELSNNTEPGYEATRRAHLRRLVELRLLSTELALQAFRQEHQSLPDSLDQLVPECLPRVPTDPCDGKPLRYRCTAQGYELYSVGEDGSDDGGKHAAPQQLIDPGTDFLLDDWAGIYPNPSSDSDSNEEIEDP